jgi:lipoprotein NlpI
MTLSRAIFLLIACTALIHLRAADQSQLSARELVRKGSDQLIAGEVKESIESFEKAVSIEPKAKPYLWQLGIAYYYAGRFQDGRQLFESHQTVNSSDVENAVWHFLCLARAEGIETARKKLIPISGDTRVPMKEVHNLFTGKNSDDDVLQAANSVNTPSERRNALCYAHLYLALYYEALGDVDKSRDHITKSASDFAQDHYMGKIAKLHSTLRSKPKLPN